MSNTNTDGLAIANITWGQIPAMTKMACGAREPMHLEGGALRFKVTSKPHRQVVVELTADDLYTVRYERAKITRATGAYTLVELESATGVYASELGETIYHMVNK